MFFIIDLVVKTHEPIQTRESAAAATIAARRASSSRGIAAGLFGAGFFAPILGIGFFIAHSFLTNDWFFSRIGSILIVVCIPLLLAGSHFLDRAEPANERREGGEGRESIFSGADLSDSKRGAK